LVPSVGRIEYVSVLLDIVQKHKVGLVVPLTDVDLRSLARQQARFAAKGCTIMVASEETVSACRDKAKTNASLKKAGLPTIRTTSLSEFRRAPFYPCFIKPIRGSGGVGAGAVNNEKELNAHLAAFGDLMIVQEYVPGREFTIDVYRSRDGQVRCVVPRQRLLIRSGEVERGITLKDPQLIETTIRLSEVLGDLWGVYCCQCRRVEGGQPYFFEINPRFGGGVPLSIAAGANLPLYLLQEVLGLPITAKIGEFTDKLMMMRYDEAVFLQVDDVRTLPGFDAPQFR
jgi:carbamoyl-phosphate synthase large subunit